MRAAFLVLILCGFGAAWSADPQKTKAQQGNQQPQTEQRGSEKAPLFVSGVITSKKDEAETKDYAKESEAKAQLDRAVVKYTFWMAIATGLLLVAAAVQAGLFVWQLRLIAASSKDAKAAADAANTSAEAVMLSERAYVKMSHHAPGVNLAEISTIDIRLENFGQTPARIIRVVVKFDLRLRKRDLPEIPDYSTNEHDPIGQTFLVRGETVCSTAIHHLTKEDLKFIQSETKDLYVYGYVRYVDIFGKTHRAGYGRQYVSGIDYRLESTSDDAWIKRNNLLFVPHGEYNYDCDEA